MGTLLLRLAGPMQAWGTQSRFTERDTGLEPAKSGVVGLLCAALGRPRREPVDDLAALRMGVRVDHEGTLAVDYHTAGGTHRLGESYGVYKASGAAPSTVVSRRYYLADADFLVGLEGEGELLRLLERALREPTWQLCLGRKSLVPGVPVWVPDGLCLDLDLETALGRYPWPGLGVALPPAEWRPERVRLVLETAGGTEVRRDQPIGAAFQERRFALRQVQTTFLALGSQVPIREDGRCTSLASS